jgi:hypothetical protein
MLQSIVELERLVSVSAEPHAIALDAQTAWISSRATRRVDVMDRRAWKKIGEVNPPGMPWGMTYDRGDILMTCGEGDDDNRRIRRCRGGDFVEGFMQCPDDTGSHLSVNGAGRILLGQWYNQRLLLLRDDGSIERWYDTPHQICGVAVTDGVVHLLGTDEEEEGDYYISRLNLGTGAAKDLAHVPFRARGLAWDGSRFWTNHREADRTVVFSLPG